MIEPAERWLPLLIVVAALVGILVGIRLFAALT